MSDQAAASSLVRLWAGENPAMHLALLEKLEAASIPFKDQPLGDDEGAPTADPLPIAWKPRFGFKIAVPSAHLLAAQEILESLLDKEPVDIALPVRSDESEDASEIPVASDAKPTLEIWQGIEEKLAQFLTSALEENGMRVHRTKSGAQSLIYVAPQNEARAREIVREVTQGAPPA